MQTILQDLRYGIRMLAKSPGFTAVAVLTLALGIGANTAIFSFINSMLLSSLPVRDANQLVLLRWGAHKSPKIHMSRSYGDCRNGGFRDANPTGCTFSKPFLEQVREQPGVFSGIAAFAGAGQLNLTGNGAASVINGELVNGDFFSTLGVRAAAGRVISPSDDTPSAPPVVMLNYGYWQSAFGGSPSAIGRTIHLNGVAFTIIGVAERRFVSIAPGNDYDVWLPFAVNSQISVNFSPRQVDAGSWWIAIVGRLKDGVSAAQAQSAISLAFRNEMLHGERPIFEEKDEPAISLLPAQKGLAGARAQYTQPLYVLSLAVGIILLIACANVAGLTLARSTARRKEMAVRLALGASRGRIARQLLTESILLSLIGGALGTLLAVWGVHAMVSFIASSARGNHFGFAISLDARVLTFTAAAAILTGILFGLAPAVRGARIDLTPALKDAKAGSLEHVRSRARWLTLGNSLVVVQVALAVIVLAGAGLMVRTLQNLKGTDPGFDTRNILLFKLNPELAGYKQASVDSLYSDLQDRLTAIPGVQAASYSALTLLSNGLMINGFHLAGTPADQVSDADMFPVGPHFFETMHMRILAGREFQAADFQIAAETTARQRAMMAAGPPKPPAPGAASPASASPAAAAPSAAPLPIIVNPAFVHKYLGNADPIGQRVGQEERSGDNPGDPGYLVVGLVNDAKYNDLRREVNPTIYSPSSGGGVSFELRTAGDPSAMIPAVREAVSKLDANLPLTDVQTQSKQIDSLLFQERLIARLASFFGILALVLACIGLYGLLAYEVARRTREIGIRMALGAQQRDVLRPIITQGIALAIAGAAVGTLAALGLTRFLSTLLFGVHPTDPVTFTAVAALLTLVALAASYIPARRATRVDPMVALRYE